MVGPIPHLRGECTTSEILNNFIIMHIWLVKI